MIGYLGLYKPVTDKLNMLTINENDLGRTKLKKVSAYIDHDMYQKFEQLAKKEMRSVSSLTAYAIAQILEKAEAEGKLQEKS